MIGSTNTAAPHLGIFDSGVGGLSVLRSVRAALPGARLSYVADNQHLPYGDKSADWLVTRCSALTEHLLDTGADLILLACNTATTHTISALRARWPQLAFVGVEPGIKPAARLSRTKRIGVMATPATLRSMRLRELVALHAADCHVYLLPCPGLATAIEEADDSRLAPLIDATCSALLAERVDTVVLGCTHYPLIALELAAQLGPDVALVDTAEAVAKRTRTLLPPMDHGSATAITAIATGPAAPVARALQRWIGEPVALHHHAW